MQRSKVLVSDDAIHSEDTAVSKGLQMENMRYHRDLHKLIERYRI